MKLIRLTDRVWIYPYEEKRDRPNLGYIRGDEMSMAVDAGHSEEHVREFYKAIEDEGLPLPSLTVLTHWQWDHTFGMHVVNGSALASEKTNGHLEKIRDRIRDEGPEGFLSFDESIRLEYEGGKSVVVTLADETYTGEKMIDLGGCKVRIFEAQSPHTDDSTLVFAEDEGVLFIGDSACGSFPSGRFAAAPALKLLEDIRSTGAKTVIEGHWIPQTLEESAGELELLAAHDLSHNHMEALKADSVCGCFYCLKIFSPSEINDWLIADNDCDRLGTAVCPYCCIDSVIGESSGFPITTEFLTRMKERWF